MAETVISGSDLLLFIDPAGGTTYSLVVCLTSQSLTRSITEIDAKSKCGPNKLPGDKTVGISFDGQLVWAPTGTNVGVSDLHDLWSSKTTIGWKYGKAVPASTDVTYSGTGFISQLDESADQDTPGTFSATIAPYGDVTKTVTP